MLSGLDRLQKIYLGTAVVVAVLAGFLITKDAWLIGLLKGAESKPMLAAIEKSKNDTRRRSGRSFTWFNIEQGAKVYDGDSLFIGPDSALELQTTDQIQILIAENSLVRLSKVGTDILLDFRMGQVEVHLKGGQKLKTHSLGEIFEIEGAATDAKISLSQNENQVLEIKSMDGTVKVNRANENLTIRPQQKIDLSLTPIVKDLTRAEAANLPEPEPKKPREIKKISKNLARVVDKALEGPLLLTPIQASEIVNVALENQKKKGVAFVWEPVDQAQSYEIEMAADEGFKTNLRKYTSSRPAMVILDLPKGKSFWRVRAINKTNLSKWSAVNSFHYDETNN